MPDTAPEGPINTSQKGLLSPIGDIVGQVADKGLKPIGHITGQVGNPAGEAMTNVKKTAKNENGYSDEDDPNKTDADLPGGESIGGKEQTNGNPLGL